MKQPGGKAKPPVRNPRIVRDADHRCTPQALQVCYVAAVPWAVRQQVAIAADLGPRAMQPLARLDPFGLTLPRELRVGALSFLVVLDLSDERGMGGVQKPGDLGDARFGRYVRRPTAHPGC